jgi:anti-anti-sigma factor
VAVAFRLDDVLELAFAAGSEEEDGALSVWVSGEFDLAGIPCFMQELDRVQRHGRDIAVVDLAQLLFIDAGALRSLMTIGDRVSDGRPVPALVGATPAISRVFEMVGLEHHLVDRR